MDQLEQDLRGELSRQVAGAPALPGLVDVVVRRGRRARRRRAVAGAAGVAALVASVALVGSTLVDSAPDRRELPVAAALEGPPRVPLLLGLEEDALVQWVDGVQTSFPLGELVPVAAVPDGVLLRVPGLALDLLKPGDDATTRVVSGLERPEVAVSADGRRVTVLKDKGLQEVEVSTGRVLRSLPLTRMFGPLRPVTYSGDAVLLVDDQQRTALWEGGDDGVLSIVLDTEVLDGAGTGSPAGLVALRTSDARCDTEVRRLSNGYGSTWRLCREPHVGFWPDGPFAGFSPDGSYVLATNADEDALVVHDADDGDERRTFPVPDGLVGQGWESEDTLLYTTLEDDRTLVVRCSVAAGRCRTATSFPFDGRMPRSVGPVRPAR